MISKKEYSTLYMQQTVTYTQVASSSVSYTNNAGVIDNKREIFQLNEKREILIKVDYG